MGVTALHLYEPLTEATDEKAKARIIAESFGQLEERYPQLKDLATQGQVRESELRLLKEIREVELKLQQTEIRLLGVEDGEAITTSLLLKLQQTEERLLEAKHRQTYWIIGSLGTLIGFNRLLDWFLANVPK